MLPGEESDIENVIPRWFHAVSGGAARLLSAVSAEHADPSARWYANPEVVNSILLCVITALLCVIAAEARVAPRLWRSRVVRRLRSRARQLPWRIMPPRRLARKSRWWSPCDAEAPATPAEFASARALLARELSRIVGLEDIKAHLSSLLDTLELDAQRLAVMPSFASRRGCMHMVFVGNPGSGKTAVAQLIASLLRELGLLRTGQLVVAKKADLLGRYANQVAKNTRAVVERALGGVLLIDEAYSLVQGEVELGRECINVLVDMAYAHRDALVVVLAGYEAGMADLFRSNAGLPSRFPHRFAFADYSAPELEAIAALMLESSGFEVADADAAAALG